MKNLVSPGTAMVLGLVLIMAGCCVLVYGRQMDACKAALAAQDTGSIERLCRQP